MHLTYLSFWAMDAITLPCVQVEFDSSLVQHGHTHKAGSYNYGQNAISETHIFANAALKVKGKQQYLVNGVSFT